MFPTPSEPVIDGAGTLLCPFCGSNNLHHQRLRAFERYEENDATATITEIFGTWTHVRVGAAPGRRNTLDVEFWCEGGEHLPVLRIQQHKGSTFFRWVEPGELLKDERKRPPTGVL